ncbi:MAG: rhomboid family intramembrane serine protease [Sphingobacteriaceae bacterium]|nr:rhomboid family intramembrane serine protease [Sphingobacteriaceae bacterium]
MNFQNIPPVVKNLLIINVLFFIAKYILTSINLDFMLGAFYFDSPLFKGWQLLTYMFMHGSFTHILFNMFALYSFGAVIESYLGSKRFINFYLITGLGALVLQWAVQAFEVYQITGAVSIHQHILIDMANNSYQNTLQGLDQAQYLTLQGIYTTPMIGASGAIFGLLIAFGMLFPNAELMIMFIPVPVKAKYIIPVYILIELSLGIAKVSGDSVAHYAHLGGALIGFLLIKLWKNKINYY